MLDKNNEVLFGEYCKTCKYERYSETDSPCAECLAEPVNLYSHKPVKWEGADGIYAGPPSRPDHAYQRAVKYVPENRKDREKAIARHNIDAEYTGNKVQTIDDKVTDDQYPSATAVKKALEGTNEATAQSLAKKIDAPDTCECGDVLTVEEVDENGKPTKWKTAPAAAEQKQADWGQNDEAAADFVKNRPGGYTVYVVKTLYNNTTYTAEENIDFEIVEGQKYVVTIDGGNPVEFTAVKETVAQGNLIYIGTNSYSEIASGSVSDYWFLGFAASGALICSESYIGKKFLITTKAKEIVKIPKKYLDLEGENLIPEIYATKNNNDLTAVEIPANVIRIRVRCINITEVTLPSYPSLLFEVINDNFYDELLTIKYGENLVGIAPPNCTVYLGYGRSHPVMQAFENNEYAIFKTNEASVIPKIGDTFAIKKLIKSDGYVVGAVIGTFDVATSSYVLIKKTGQVDVNCAQDKLGVNYENITSADDGKYIKLIKYITGQLCKYNYTNVGIEDVSWRLAYVKSFDTTTNIATVILF